MGPEELEPGQFEIGFLIPRDAVDNELEQLGREFVELDKILGPLLEATAGTRPELEIRSISSSGFQLFLDAYSDFALTLARVVESLISSYQKIRGMRETVEKLEESGVPEAAYADLVAHANERMDLDIQALTEELVRDVAARLPQGREHELSIDVKHSLRRLAKRIDEGYSIEVRAFTVPDNEKEAQDVDVRDTDLVAAREIAQRQPRMRSMNLTGRPILELPEGEDENAVEPPAEDPEP